MATPSFIPTAVNVENGGDFPMQMQQPFPYQPYMPTSPQAGFDYDQNDFENEPPLMEELGINPDHIKRKTIAVLNPLQKQIDDDLLDDADLAGPFCYAFLLGFVLLMTGKWCYDNIYGFFSVGCICMYLLVNLMSNEGIDAYRTVSILGYCLLPMVLLAFLSVFLPLTSLFGFIASFVCVMWCARSAALLFTPRNRDDQRYLLAYPLAMYYTCFALLTIF